MCYRSLQPLVSPHIVNPMVGEYARINCIAADHYFALGLQALAEEVVRTQSHWGCMLLLALVYHHDMLYAFTEGNDLGELHCIYAATYSLSYCRD